jgi:hypothetical protein
VAVTVSWAGKSKRVGVSLRAAPLTKTAAGAESAAMAVLALLVEVSRRGGRVRGIPLPLKSFTSWRLLPAFLVRLAGGESGGDRVITVGDGGCVVLMQSKVVVVVLSVVGDWDREALLVLVHRQ